MSLTPIDSVSDAGWVAGQRQPIYFVVQKDDYPCSEPALMGGYWSATVLLCDLFLIAAFPSVRIFKRTTDRLRAQYVEINLDRVKADAVVDRSKERTP